MLITLLPAAVIAAALITCTVLVLRAWRSLKAVILATTNGIAESNRSLEVALATANRHINRLELEMMVLLWKADLEDDSPPPPVTPPVIVVNGGPNQGQVVVGQATFEINKKLDPEKK